MLVKKEKENMPNPNIESNRIIIERGNEVTIIPFRSISYYTELKKNNLLEENKRLKIVTLDGSSHPLPTEVIDLFKTNFTNWLVTTKI